MPEVPAGGEVAWGDGTQKVPETSVPLVEKYLACGAKDAEPVPGGKAATRLSMPPSPGPPEPTLDKVATNIVAQVVPKIPPMVDKNEQNTEEEDVQPVPGGKGATRVATPTTRVPSPTPDPTQPAKKPQPLKRTLSPVPTGVQGGSPRRGRPPKQGGAAHGHGQGAGSQGTGWDGSQPKPGSKLPGTKVLSNRDILIQQSSLKSWMCRKSPGEVLEVDEVGGEDVGATSVASVHGGWG